MSKKFILNADDFGMSEAHNRAVLEGYEGGLLKSVSLVSNGEAYDEAVSKILPSCPDLGVGVHLNIIEGNSLCQELTELTDANGKFNQSYGSMILKAYNTKNKAFSEQIETEFRAQIEKVQKSGIEITHIDSHVHTHAIPPIFDIAAKLAKEYGIKQIRMQFERPYFIPDPLIFFNNKYYINLVKIALLDTFTLINKSKLDQYELNTNDYLIGVGYTSMMTPLAVSCGISAIKEQDDLTVETLIHPCRYEEGIIDSHFVEFQITKHAKLKKKIEEMGFEITNYRDLLSAHGD